MSGPLIRSGQWSQTTTGMTQPAAGAMDRELAQGWAGSDLSA